MCSHVLRFGAVPGRIAAVVPERATAPPSDNWGLRYERKPAAPERLPAAVLLVYFMVASHPSFRGPPD